MNRAAELLFELRHPRGIGHRAEVGGEITIGAARCIRFPGGGHHQRAGSKAPIAMQDCLRDFSGEAEAIESGLTARIGEALERLEISIGRCARALDPGAADVERDGNG